MVLFSKLWKRTPNNPTHFCLRFSCASAIRFWHVMYVVQTQTGENFSFWQGMCPVRLCLHRLCVYFKSIEKTTTEFQRKEEETIKLRDVTFLCLSFTAMNAIPTDIPRIAWRKRFGRTYMCLCLYVLYTWLLHIFILYTYRRAAFVSVFFSFARIWAICSARHPLSLLFIRNSAQF